jgi:hydroxyacylglutathione hydrolase
MVTIEIRQRSVGPWPMNTYALVCPATRQSALIDPGADPETLHQMLADTTPQAILLTHADPDHVGALEEMRQQLSVPLLAHSGPHPGGLRLIVDRELGDGETIELGEQTITAIYAPGHTQDMLCFASGNVYVVGDTIFEGGPGFTRSAADFRQTLNTLRQIVLAWPDDAICYPGHGPAFRLGDQRTKIERFLSKDHGAFSGNAEWEM